MKDRIKQLMESQHMTQQIFSDFIGISSASLSSIFNERTRPTLATVEAIRKKFPTISLDWLMYGTGPMFLDDVPVPQNVSTSGSPSVSEAKLDFSTDSLPPSRQGGSTPSVYEGVAHTPNNIVRSELKYVDKPKRNITEIRVFFDDQTYESFVPRK